MIEIELPARDLADVRFCTDPVWEATMSLHGITQPDRFPLHRRLRSLLPDDPAFDLGLLLELTRPRRWIPDLLVPVPGQAATDPVDRYAQVATTDPALVEGDLRVLRNLMPGSRVAAMQPAELAERTAVALTGYWHAVLEPLWDRVEGIAGADIAHRSAQSSSAGLNGVLSGVHHLMTYGAGVITVAKGNGRRRFASTGRGLRMVPSVFSWPRVVVACHSGRPVISYAARGAGLLWERPAPAPADALAALVGRSRAAILELLELPRTTSDLAEQLRLSPGTVSEHLSVLAAAGLVRPRRQGKRVLYARTALAVMLVDPGRAETALN